MAKNDTATAAVKKKWYQFWAKTNKQIDDNADPEVQLYQAINHAKEMSRQLETDAAKVIAQEQLAEMKLAELIDQEQKLEAKLETAVALSDAEQSPAKKQQLDAAIDQVSGELDRLEREIQGQQALVVKASAASQAATAAVEQNKRQMKEALNEQHALLAANSQAAAQESLNSAMASIGDSVGDGITPTLASVREKINARYATAAAVTQLNRDPAADAMAAIEAATSSGSANARVAAIRAKKAGELSAPAAPLAIASAGEVINTTATDVPAPAAKRYDPNA